MASSLADAEQMQKAAETAGIKILIHWYMPFSQLMQRTNRLLNDGVIGDILEIKMRAAPAGPLAPGVKHPGPDIATVAMTGEEMASTWWYQTAAGGGAMIDFCSYGAIISRWLIGEQANGVTAMKANLNSKWSEADDNGVIVARFRNAIGIFEGSWTTLEPGITGGPIIYGTKGTLVVDEWGEKPHVRVISNGGRSTVYDGVALPERRQDVAQEFIHHLETGVALHPTLDLPINLDATVIVDAGLRSIASAKHEQICGLPHD